MSCTGMRGTHFSVIAMLCLSVRRTQWRWMVCSGSAWSVLTVPWWPVGGHCSNGRVEVAPADCNCMRGLALPGCSVFLTLHHSSCVFCKIAPSPPPSPTHTRTYCRSGWTALCPFCMSVVKDIVDRVLLGQGLDRFVRSRCRLSTSIATVCLHKVNVLHRAVGVCSCIGQIAKARLLGD